MQNSKVHSFRFVASSAHAPLITTLTPGSTEFFQLTGVIAGSGDMFEIAMSVSHLRQLRDNLDLLLEDERRV
ncbi:hypothetical protein [Nostoc sp.]